MFRQLSSGLFLITQFVLWTACALTVLGVFWRNVPFDSRIMFFGFLVALIAVAEIFWWKRSLSAPPFQKDEEHTKEEFDVGAIQQIVRFRTEDGTERLEGMFLVEFATEQRVASVHVPFCPAFESTPMVEALLLEGEATLSAVKPCSFGVRIDVKRRGNESVRILVTAFA